MRPTTYAQQPRWVQLCECLRA
ncbi:hypothetical protein CTRU02_206672 [Colletotrichum truncatum]|uniref:Uncharacterized protein n=1 Tax=Colletotrichum truncatum TaxID=5467 RepID=A0ACC3Z7K9_COLTU|nr:hypothetical protein CTRU02_13792 [Colletotrichum truncatum]